MTLEQERLEAEASAFLICSGLSVVDSVRNMSVCRKITVQLMPQAERYSLPKGVGGFLETATMREPNGLYEPVNTTNVAPKIEQHRRPYLIWLEAGNPVSLRISPAPDRMYNLEVYIAGQNQRTARLQLALVEALERVRKEQIQGRLAQVKQKAARLAVFGDRP